MRQGGPSQAVLASRPLALGPSKLVTGRLGVGRRSGIHSRRVPLSWAPKRSSRQSRLGGGIAGSISCTPSPGPADLAQGTRVGSSAPNEGSTDRDPWRGNLAPRTQAASITHCSVLSGSLSEMASFAVSRARRAKEAEPGLRRSNWAKFRGQVTRAAGRDSAVPRLGSRKLSLGAMRDERAGNRHGAAVTAWRRGRRKGARRGGWESCEGLEETRAVCDSCAIASLHHSCAHAR